MFPRILSKGFVLVSQQKQRFEQRFQDLPYEIRHRILLYRTRLENNRDIWSGKKLCQSYVDELDYGRLGSTKFAQIMKDRRATKEQECLQDNLMN